MHKVLPIPFIFFLFLSAIQLSASPCNEQKRIVINETTPITEPFITFPYLEISRLGDYAMGYLNAKWIAAKLKVPVVLRPFPHSSQLKISENLPYQLDDSLKKEDFIKLTKEQMDKILAGELSKNELGPGIFTIPFPWEYWFVINRYENPELVQSFIDDFLPASHIHPEIIWPKEGMVNIAIHIRDGGAFDILADKFRCPDRFPPLSYYDRQLEKVLTMDEYRGKNVHVQLFTDAVDPQVLKDHFLEIGRKFCSHITVESRANDHDCDTTIISDLLSLSKYPIMIRTCSFFSWLAAFLGRPSLEFYPINRKLYENGVAETNTVRIIRRLSDSHTIEDIEENHTKKWPLDDFSEFNEVFDWNKRKSG